MRHCPERNVGLRDIFFFNLGDTRASLYDRNDLEEKGRIRRINECEVLE